MSKYKLVALDLDGTLFNNQSCITEGNLAEIRRITNQGVYAVISTGRPFCGVPLSRIEGSGIRYAITTNGSAVYDIAEKKCIYEDSMEPEMVLPIMEYLLGRDIHFDVFIGGEAYSPEKCYAVGTKLAVPSNLKEYILNSRVRIGDMISFIWENDLRVQKITMNFYRDENGVLKDREEIRQYFSGRDDVTCVSGGYNNLEFTKGGVNKGTGLCRLASILDLPLSRTVAIGDTENDLAIIQAAGLGIAMGNATDAVKAASDDVTLSNEEDGVAAAIRKYF